jgi:hypothetical protein
MVLSHGLYSNFNHAPFSLFTAQEAMCAENLTQPSLYQQYFPFCPETATLDPVQQVVKLVR